MDQQNLPVNEQLKVLVASLDGDEENNLALSQCKDAEEMLDILLKISSQSGLGLSRNDLKENPPTRDWIWWKNKEALVNLGDNNLRHQQDSAVKTRWDSWTINFFKFLRIWR